MIPFWKHQETIIDEVGNVFVLLGTQSVSEREYTHTRINTPNQSACEPTTTAVRRVDVHQCQGHEIAPYVAWLWVRLQQLNISNNRTPAMASSKSWSVSQNAATIHSGQKRVSPKFHWTVLKHLCCLLLTCMKTFTNKYLNCLISCVMHCLWWTKNFLHPRVLGSC